MSSGLADRIDALLPQTQCARCGFPACRPYAEALAAGDTDLNRCPPGGQATIDALATLLGRPSAALDPSCGQPWHYTVAHVDEAWCIGCTVCIGACPVDAFVGAAKLMHSVIAEDCTGCELCVEPCPTGCIQMLPAAQHPQAASLGQAWTQPQADRARRQYQHRSQRLEAAARNKATARRRRALRRLTSMAKRDAIGDAVARVRARRQTSN